MILWVANTTTVLSATFGPSVSPRRTDGETDRRRRATQQMRGKRSSFDIASCRRQIAWIIHSQPGGNVRRRRMLMASLQRPACSPRLAICTCISCRRPTRATESCCRQSLTITVINRRSSVGAQRCWQTTVQFITLWASTLSIDAVANFPSPEFRTKFQREIPLFCRYLNFLITH